MHKRTLMAVLIGSSVLAAAPALAQTTTATPTTTTTAAANNSTVTATTAPSTAVSGRSNTRVAQDFTTFAGSSSNADSLVNGLRHDAPITLTSGTTGQPGSTVTFTPPTRPMGTGNTFISLALARQQLTNLGITHPTPEQLRAALVGGTVTASNGKSTTLTGVLTMRAQGQGWGRIARADGVRLGQVISQMKTAHVRAPENLASRRFERAEINEHNELHHGDDHRATTAAATRSSTRAAASRGITTAAGTTGARVHAFDASDHTARGVTGSGRGIVTATGTSPAAVRMASTGEHGGASSTGAVSAGAAGRSIVTAAGGSSVTTGIVHADGSGAGGARGGGSFAGGRH